VIGDLPAVRSDGVRDARAPVDRARDGIERRGRGDGPSAAVRGRTGMRGPTRRPWLRRESPQRIA
jgi:hypothetical protein